MGHKVSVFFERQYHSLYKYLLHLWTGHSEIARICSGDFSADNGGNSNKKKMSALHNIDMTIAFARSLQASKQLADIATTVFTFQEFSVVSMKKVIVTKKHLLIADKNTEETRRKSTIANLTKCLESLRTINSLYQALTVLRKTVFSYTDNEHVTLLNSLWQHLKPTYTTNDDQKDWGEIGFQGKDPATDFRGMGLLGLIQLQYFSANYPQQAQYILNLSNNPSYAYFPFAATSINMTALVLQLYQENRFYVYLLEKNSKNSTIYSSNKTENRKSENTESEKKKDNDNWVQEEGLAAVHDLYCEMYIEFAELWKRIQPKDLMDFPPIFALFKENLMKRYPAL